MQSLQQKTSEWSGVAPSDAFAIDETNLFKALGGYEGLHCFHNGEPSNPHKEGIVVEYSGVSRD
ncbi:hypothetical protein ACMD2_25492 [Ananas comosus]|uniref:Uncharacterized protein n=1 Tax=Ananas comosus TaxID=4615 RepID=A0A199W100_ANACO|nr:hypothetical protein ACMD2_25492 [Ananas comosus]